MRLPRGIKEIIGLVLGAVALVLVGAVGQIYVMVGTTIGQAANNTALITPATTFATNVLTALGSTTVTSIITVAIILAILKVIGFDVVGYIKGLFKEGRKSKGSSESYGY